MFTSAIFREPLVIIFEPGELLYLVSRYREKLSVELEFGNNRQ